MPSGRQPGFTGGIRVRDLLFLSLLAPIAAAALQQRPPRKYTDEHLSNHAPVALGQAWTASTPDSLNPPEHRRSRHHNSNVNHKDENDNVRTPPLNQRALATLSPAEHNSAVRDPPAQRSSVSTAGLNSRLLARSLQDWQVEDIMLLATVDGNLHARDRKTGSARWTLEVDREMVETVHHRRNRTVDEHGIERDDPMFIIEPSQDGAIYILAPHYGLQRLEYTVKQLAELAPYASDGYPPVAYTAEKKTTLYTVDAATGVIQKVFSSAGSIVNEDRSCRRVNFLESLDEEECESIGTLTLGRTEYIIGIQDRDTGEHINTVKYSEWAANNRDVDLQNKYTSTLDRKYVYSKYDGTIFGLDLTQDAPYSPAPIHKPIFHQKFPSPVVRVFDVVRQVDDSSSDASLVVLPQPTGPSPNEWAGLEDETPESVFLGCTASDNWYALSETKYPAVTEGASDAKYYSDDLLAGISVRTLSVKVQREKLIGVHRLSHQGHKPWPRQIGAPEHPRIDAPTSEPQPVVTEIQVSSDPVPRQEHSLVQVAVVVIALAIFGCVVLYKQLGLTIVKAKTAVEIPELVSPAPDIVATPTAEKKARFIREAEPAEETILPHEDADSTKHVQSTEVAKDDAVPEADLADAGAEDAEDVEEPKKKRDKEKKATRGKRGGRKHREREAAQAEAKAKKAQAQVPQAQVPQAQEIISVAASESREVSGSLQINSLVVHTDRIIGQGSCGTIVFEGSFEGRDVAVKRMLSQYYELAFQEVSFLQQSDDHPNVVRYFCQQKDDHFLYIAVELCQASLLEVWEADKARTEERQTQLKALKLAIQQDMTRTLHQLAAGLCHLHSLRIIHRDIKPQNILVAFPKRTQPSGTTRLVISDFGLGKNLPENVSTLVDPTANAGTSGWKAPELISQPRDTASNHSHSNSYSGNSENGTGAVSGVKRAADIFALGCLFFWALTDGVHPFEDENGWQQLREYNIKRGKKNMDALAQWSDSYEPMQLITWMLEQQPEHRPTAQAVLNHPYFWPAEKRLAFLCDVSDHFEREPRGVYDDDYAGDSPHLNALETRAREVIGSPFDFLAKLDRHFVDTLGKQRKYSGYRLLDLLRALRNKKNHYEDMPEDVKKRVGPLAGGYLNYWTNRFPRLLMACYEVVHETGVQDHDRFKGYFALGNV